MSDTLPAEFDALTVGDRFSTNSRVISEHDVNRFADLTGDHHPQHVDAAWAASSFFGDRIAHGLLVFSCAAGLVPFDPERVIALRRIRDMVFKRPVLLGEAIHVEGKVQEITPLEGNVGLVAVGLRVLLSDGQLALRATLDVVWKRDSGSPETDPQTTEVGGPAHHVDR